MRNLLLIARRDLSAYLRTWNGYIIFGIVLLVNGLLFNATVLGKSGAQRSSEILATFFQYSSFFTGTAAVFLSMRLFAEERQTGTLQLLYSSPVRDTEIVLGKFFSALAFLCLFLALSVYMPALIFVHGKVSLGHLFSGYLGLVLMGAACLALGTLGSALTKSQVVAVIIAAALNVSLVITWMLASVTQKPFSAVFGAMALYVRYRDFETGVIHLRDVVYFLLVTYVALFATTRVLEARRWR